MKAAAMGLFLWIAVVQPVCAQSSFLPKNLGSQVNSTYDDINPVISPDGKTLFFVRVNHPENTYGAEDSEDIWVAQAATDSTWATATRVSNLNIARYNAVLSISADGKTILLNGVFNKKGNTWKKRGLSTSFRSAKNWLTPEPLKVKKLHKRNSGLKSSGSMSADGSTIVLSFAKAYNSKSSNLFVIEKSDGGKWGRPKKIKSLNTSFSEDAPFLSSDGKTLYFSSDRSGKDQFDIYKAKRMGTDWQDWATPQALSDTINSKGWESYFKTNKVGSWAYFSSTTKSIGKADIFKVKLFEENPFVIVYGTVVNGRTQKPLTGKKYSIVSNGNLIDSLKINFDSATYRARLPLNELYSISAQLTNFTSHPQLLDVKGVKEFTKREINLSLDPFPYVIVKGKLLVQDTGLPIPVYANTKIWINNLPGDSIKVDMLTATYEMKINHGSSYDLKVTADRYEAVPEKLDLTTVEEYEEITLDLYVAEEKMALITGKIIDKKTGKPVANVKNAKVIVEGFTSSVATIDTLQATYEVKLPFGNTYTISAAAHNYYPLYESVDTRQTQGDVKIYKDLIIVPIEVGQSIRLNNIFFDPAKATLKSESFVELDRVAEFFANNPEIKVEIAGHTDNVGTVPGNLKLSQNRAQTVADYIIKKGIPKNRIVAKGYGLGKPIVSNATKEGKAKNRRVEFTILDK